jgi:hypothetical protein
VSSYHKSITSPKLHLVGLLDEFARRVAKEHGVESEWSRAQLGQLAALRRHILSNPNVTRTCVPCPAASQGKARRYGSAAVMRELTLIPPSVVRGYASQIRGPAGKRRPKSENIEHHAGRTSRPHSGLGRC